jgi:hypothetical protein
MTTPVSLALAARNPECGEALHGLLEEAASLEELARRAPRPFSTPIRPAPRPTARASVRAALRKVFA